MLKIINIKTMSECQNVGRMSEECQNVRKSEAQKLRMSERQVETQQRDTSRDVASSVALFRVK